MDHLKKDCRNLSVKTQLNLSSLVASGDVLDIDDNGPYDAAIRRRRHEDRHL